jgi:hypothetical protein
MTGSTERDTVAGDELAALRGSTDAVIWPIDLPARSPYGQWPYGQVIDGRLIDLPDPRAALLVWAREAAAGKIQCRSEHAESPVDDSRCIGPEGHPGETHANMAGQVWTDVEAAEAGIRVIKKSRAA